MERYHIQAPPGSSVVIFETGTNRCSPLCKHVKIDWTSISQQAPNDTFPLFRRAKSGDGTKYWAHLSERGPELIVEQRTPEVNGTPWMDTPKEEHTYVIYALIDPRDASVKYIGMTHDAHARFIQHLRGNTSNHRKNEWIQSLQSLNQMVMWKTLEYASSLEEAMEREAYWMNYYLEMGVELLNQSVPDLILEEERIADFLQRQKRIHRHPLGTQRRRICSECGTSFKIKNAKQQTCSDACRKAKQRRLRREHSETAA